MIGLQELQLNKFGILKAVHGTVCIKRLRRWRGWVLMMKGRGGGGVERPQAEPRFARGLVLINSCLPTVFSHSLFL